MTLEKTLENRLKEGGWTFVRNGGNHRVWQHPNGATFALPFRMKEDHRKKMNYLKDIERREKFGRNA